MKHLNLLPVTILIIGLLLLGGCSSGDSGSNPTANNACPAVVLPPTPFDEASRAVSVAAEFKHLHCECLVQGGEYACVADCLADNFKLEPNADAQCLRDVFTGNPLDATAIECGLTVLEDFTSCYAAASCNPDAIISCVLDTESREAMCPQGPATSGDTFSIALANGITIPGGPPGSGVPELLTVNMPSAELFFSKDKFYPSALIEPKLKLPTFTNTDVDSLAGGTFVVIEDGSEQNFDITDFTVTADNVDSSKYNYTVTGTLASGVGNPIVIDGTPLFISVKHDINAVPEFTSNAVSVRQSLWEVTADYSLGAAENLPFASDVPTQLIAKDSLFTEQSESCSNLPGDQLATIYGESLDTNFDESCRCAPDDASRTQCLLAKGSESPRNECLAKLLDSDPLATEITECIIGGLDRNADKLAELVCCANPDDTSCLSSSGGNIYSGTSAAAFFCANSDAELDTAEAIFSCMGPPPPPPLDFSDDPARCDNMTELASGMPGDFMVVTHSRKLDSNSGEYYPRHYMIMDLNQLTELATLDAAQPLLLSLYTQDADTSADRKDQCEEAGKVSIALDGDGSPPDLNALNDRINELQNGLENLSDFIAQGKAEAEAYAEDLYQNSVCPAVEESLEHTTRGDKKATKLLLFIIRKSILSRLGC